MTLPAPPYVSSFMSYDVGTLKMTGKTPADISYAIGPLRFTGRSVGSARYDVGTSSTTGKHER